MSAQPSSIQAVPRTAPIRLGLCGVGRTGYGRIRRELGPMLVPADSASAGRDMHTGGAEARPCRAFTLAAAFDLLPERSRRLAAECGSRVHSSYASLLADPAVDLVVIATRSDSHAAMAEAGLRAGKHVLVEKPMGVTLAEADHLVSVARQARASQAGHGPQLLVRLSKRFEPAFTAARDVVSAGLLGRIHGVQIRVGEFVPRSDWQTLRRCGGGQLLNWGPHVVDWAMQLLGGSAEVLWCELRRIAAAGDAEDHVKLLLRGDADVLADIEVSGGNAAPQPLLIVQGDRGALTAWADRVSIRTLKQPLDRLRRLASETPPPLEDRSYKSLPPDAWSVSEQPLDPARGEAMFWCAVHDALSGRAPFPVSLEQAREVMRIIDRAREMGLPALEARERERRT